MLNVASKSLNRTLLVLSGHSRNIWSGLFCTSDRHLTITPPSIRSSKQFRERDYRYKWLVLGPNSDSRRYIDASSFPRNRCPHRSNLLLLQGPLPPFAFKGHHQNPQTRGSPHLQRSRESHPKNLRLVGPNHYQGVHVPNTTITEENGPPHQPISLRSKTQKQAWLEEAQKAAQVAPTNTLLPPRSRSQAPKILTGPTSQTPRSEEEYKTASPSANSVSLFTTHRTTANDQGTNFAILGEKARENKEKTERETRNLEYAGNSYRIPEPSDFAQDSEVSGLPWGGMNMSHCLQRGHAAQSQRSSGRGTYVGDDSFTTGQYNTPQYSTQWSQPSPSPAPAPSYYGGSSGGEEYYYDDSYYYDPTGQSR